jgi:hypothetical protein
LYVDGWMVLHMWVMQRMLRALHDVALCFPAPRAAWEFACADLK